MKSDEDVQSHHPCERDALLLCNKYITFDGLSASMNTMSKAGSSLARDSAAGPTMISTLSERPAELIFSCATYMRFVDIWSGKRENI